MALYHPPGQEETLAISPLDDGSVCIWDISGKSGSKGRIIQRSKPGLLSVEGDGKRSKMVSTGVTECISVDSFQNTLYVAVQSSKFFYFLCKFISKVSYGLGPRFINSGIRNDSPISIQHN